MLGDLSFDPPLPLTAAPFAGEIIRRDEGEEEARFGKAVVNAVLPVVEATDVLFVKKGTNSRDASPPVNLRCSARSSSMKRVIQPSTLSLRAYETKKSN